MLPPNQLEDVANWTVGSTPRVAWGMRLVREAVIYVLAEFVR